MVYRTVFPATKSHKINSDAYWSSCLNLFQEQNKHSVGNNFKCSVSSGRSH